MSTIYWLDTEPKVAMAVVSCPRGDEKLKGDLADLKSGGIDTVLSLLEADEAVWLGLGDEGKMAFDYAVKPGEWQSFVPNAATLPVTVQAAGGGLHFTGAVVGPHARLDP